VPILEVRSPGVYGFEREPSRAPEGLSPAKAAFVGWTDEGLTNSPVEVRSFEEFERIFGNISTLGLVPIEVNAFFATGGERCYIVRAVAADAVAAAVDIDTAPVKWTFTSNGEGVWGNDTTVRIRGNRNFLNRTTGSVAWEKFDVLILRPSDFDDTILEAQETFTAVQFTDPDAGDYVSLVMLDPRAPSTLVDITEGAGGTPAGLLATQVEDEVVVAGGSVNGIDTNFSGTLALFPVLDGSLTLIAADATIDDEAQTPNPAITGSEAAFSFTLPTAPVLDGSLRLFFAKTPDVVAETPVLAIGTIGVDTTYQIAASALANPVHRENTVFRIRYAAVAASSPENLLVGATGGQNLDLSTTPLTDTPVHPGTVSIACDTIDDGPTTIIDDGNGNLSGVSLPGGGTINYTTGVMSGLITGSAASGLTAVSNVVATYDESSVITKAASADNMAQGVALAGAVVVGPGSVMDLVDSLTAPTGNGVIDFVTSTIPLGGTQIYVDYVPLGIVESDVAGTLTGDLGAADPTYTNTVDFTTGVVALRFDTNVKNTTTIDADYQTGQVATDDGLGRLVGDVDPAGTNTIDYATGAYDIDWDSPPVGGTAILGNYYQLASFVDYPMTGGLNGAAVSRSDISAAALEASKTGIYALDLVEEPLNVVVPDFEGSEFVQFDLVQFARARADSRYLIMGFANGTTVEEAVQYNLVTQAWNEKIGALYYPNIYYVNPVTDRAELIPVTGFAAGVYSKTANNKNIGKSPGGIEDGALDGVGTVGPEVTLDLAQRDDLYSSRINPVINSQATGLAIWGVRSLSKESRWQWVNARQLHNFLMFAISLNLQWAVFENNGPPLWIRIETALKGYMGSLFRLGYFAGEVEEEAFFVKCNATNNNAQTVAEGKAIVDIGFNPNSPAEFIIFTLQQPVGQTVTA
jgi:hypothetical protein